MTDTALKETVTRLAEPLVAALGLVIWGVEIVRAGRTAVRLFVDVPASPQDSAATAPAAPACGRAAKGALLAETADEPDMAALSATLDQCAEISRHLGLALEVEDSIAEAYVLEVSTPGLTRLFFSLEQMRPYGGQMVEARLLSPVAAGAGPQWMDPACGAPRRLWRGRLEAVEDEAFVLAPASVSAEGLVEPENLPPVRIPWSAVRRASRMYIFQQPQKPGKGPKKGPGKIKNDRQNAVHHHTDR